jgi:hypothetical protein
VQPGPPQTQTSDATGVKVIVPILTLVLGYLFGVKGASSG